MNQNHLAAAVVFATLAPLFLYLLLGFSRKSKPQNVSDYNVADRSLGKEDFANTSVGYALQMAAVFLFVEWGFRYGFGGFWVPLFWLVGYLLLYAFIPRFAPFLEKTWTLHGFLGDRFRSPALQLTAACATILGLWGTMMVEIDYCTAIYAPMLGVTWKDGGTFILALLFLTFGVSYVIYGGYKATVNNERWQVPIAYCCFLAVILTTMSMVRTAGNEVEFRVLYWTMIVLLGSMMIAKLNLVNRMERVAESIAPDSQIWIPIAAFIALVIMDLYVPVGVVRGVASDRLPGITTNIWGQIHAQGGLTLLSLFVANAFWMPVDVSTWQRISSIKLNKLIPLPQRLAPVRKGIFRVMLESPVSWGFGVVFGMALKYSGLFTQSDDPSGAIDKFTGAAAALQLKGLGLGNWMNLILPVFIVATISIMLSTVDELLSAISFTASADILEQRKGAESTLSRQRNVTVLICVVGAVVYYGCRFILKIEIATVLYLFYSSQLALFPTVFAGFWANKFDARAAIASILIGFGSGVASAFITFGSVDPSLIPPLACLTFSTVTYLIISKINIANKNG